MTEIKGYMSWAILWNMTGQMYFADIKGVGTYPSDFGTEVEKGPIGLNTESVYEYHSALAYTQEGALTRKTMVLPVDMLIGAGKMFVKVVQYVYFSEMHELDRKHYVELVKNGENVRKETREKLSPIKIVGSLPPSNFRG
jgi:hypothetical protein